MPRLAQVEQFMPHLLEIFYETALHWLAGCRGGPPMQLLAHHRRATSGISTSPLPVTIIPGCPRRSIRAVSSHATRRPEIGVSGIAARRSRVTSSTTLSRRKRWPGANCPKTKSSGQRALGRAFPLAHAQLRVVVRPKVRPGFHRQRRKIPQQDNVHLG